MACWSMISTKTVGDGGGHGNGFEKLKQLDSNKDQRIDSKDTVDGRSALDVLQVWKDGNTNGLSEAGELRSLNETGVTALNLNYADLGENPIDSNGNTIRQTSTFESGPTTTLTHTLADVWFAVAPAVTTVTQVNPTPETAPLAMA
jgi:trimeric autotransporter adhesin